MLVGEDGLTRITDFQSLWEPLPTLLAYWERKRGSRAMPAPRDMDPVEIPRLIPWLAILDVTHEPLDARYRLMGTRIVEMGGVDRTGQSFRDGHSGARLEERLTALRQLMAERTPVALSGRLDWLGRDYRRFQCIHLPLSENDSVVSRLVAAYAFS